MSTKITFTVVIETHDKQTITHTNTIEEYGDNARFVGYQVDTALATEAERLSLIIAAAYGPQGVPTY